jgi:glutathione synthase/RimK-type ligase-like ATP-grasp enzyme
MPTPVHVLYENPAWLPPLESALRAEGLDYRLAQIGHGLVDLAREPEPGIYLNRMSPSAHTRGHVASVDTTAELLAWLEHHGRRVVNGSRAFALDVSKARQDLVLRRHGIRTPRTVLAVGRDAVVRGATLFDGPFLTKHNQGGKGLGIRLFASAAELEAYVDSADFDPGPRGLLVLQEYVRPREPFITRVEIVAGRFLYAMRADTRGGFELCPADACSLERAAERARAAPDACPADGAAEFTLSPIGADDPLVEKYVRMCEAEGLEIAGIEFVEDERGIRYTYDINANTNYNGAVGRQAGIDGMREIARHLGRLAAEGGSHRGTP